MRSQVSGRPAIDLAAAIDRRDLRFQGDAASCAFLSMQQAIAQSGLTPEQVSNPRTGLVAGSGRASSLNQVWAADTLRAKIKRVGPFMVTRTMGSTVSACLATPFGIKGVHSITSACATSAHRIGHAAQPIAWGQQDVVFINGGEESWSCRCCSTRWARCPRSDTSRAPTSARFLRRQPRRFRHRRRRRHAGAGVAGAQARAPPSWPSGGLRRHLRRPRRWWPVGRGARCAACSRRCRP